MKDTQKIEMLNGYIMIKDLPIKETKTESGLIIPGVAYQRIAEVKAVGPGSRFKPGDIVLKPVGRSTPVTIDDIDYECIKEAYIFAKV